MADLGTKVSQRRAQQVIKAYRKAGQEPILGGRIGRPNKPYDEKEGEILRAAH